MENYFSINNELFMVLIIYLMILTSTLVIISFRKEIMFWVCYLPTLWHDVIKYPVFSEGVPKPLNNSHHMATRLVGVPNKEFGETGGVARKTLSIYNFFIPPITTVIWFTDVFYGIELIIISVTLPTQISFSTGAAIAYFH